jgi:hypothetical protein
MRQQCTILLSWSRRECGSLPDGITSIVAEPSSRVLIHAPTATPGTQSPIRTMFTSQLTILRPIRSAWPNNRTAPFSGRLKHSHGGNEVFTASTRLAINCASLTSEPCSRVDRPERREIVGVHRLIAPNGVGASCPGRGQLRKGRAGSLAPWRLHVIYRQARPLPLLLDTSVLQQWAAWL